MVSKGNDDASKRDAITIGSSCIVKQRKAETKEDQQVGQPDKVPNADVGDKDR